MRSRLAVLALGFALAFAAIAAEPPLPESDNDIGYASPAKALAALRARPEVKFREENGWIVAVDEAAHTYWSFTTEALPGHPAVVKRTLVERDGSIYMQMGVMCGGSKEDCDAIVRLFQANDAKLKEQVGGG